MPKQKLKLVKSDADFKCPHCSALLSSLLYKEIPSPAFIVATQLIYACPKCRKVVYGYG